MRWQESRWERKGVCVCEYVMGVGMQTLLGLMGHCKDVERLF